MNLPSEIIFKILLPMSLADILNYAQSNHQAHQICKDKYFWTTKALQDHNAPLDVILGKNLVHAYAITRIIFHSSDPLLTVIELNQIPLLKLWCVYATRAYYRQSSNKSNYYKAALDLLRKNSKCFDSVVPYIVKPEHEKEFMIEMYHEAIRAGALNLLKLLRAHLNKIDNL